MLFVSQTTRDGHADMGQVWIMSMLHPDLTRVTKKGPILGQESGPKCTSIQTWVAKSETVAVLGLVQVTKLYTYLNLD